MDVLTQIVRKEGLLGLYAGMESTFWRLGQRPRTHPIMTCSFVRSLGTFGGMEDTLGVYSKYGPNSPKPK